MKNATRLFCLIAALLLMMAVGASAENTDQLAVVSYDRAALIDWMPGYRLNMPGVLLELSHTEGLMTVSSVETELTSAEYLSERLDRAGEMLAVSDAVLTLTPDSSGFLSLSSAYTYLEGDEPHLAHCWAAGFGDHMILEFSVDTWGLEAEELMSSVVSSFSEGGFAVTRCADPVDLTAMLTDVVSCEDGTVQIQLTGQDETASEGVCYPFWENAVILFPNPDDPSLFYPVEPDMASLVDAVLTYEENSDSPAMFRTIIQDGAVLYMEYQVLIP